MAVPPDARSDTGRDTRSRRKVLFEVGGLVEGDDGSFHPQGCQRIISKGLYVGGYALIQGEYWFSEHGAGNVEKQYASASGFRVVGEFDEGFKVEFLVSGRHVSLIGVHRGPPWRLRSQSAFTTKKLLQYATFVKWLESLTRRAERITAGLKIRRDLTRTRGLSQWRAR